MKNFTFIVYFIFCVLASNAQIQGPLSGGTFSIIAIPGSNQTWNNPGNVISSDDSYSNFNNLIGGVGTYTDYLVASNFGFSIPMGVTLTGIIVEIERSDPNFRTADYRVRILKGGTVGTAERAAGSSYPFTDSYQSYGNAGDLWGESWTDADINASDFGVAVAAQRSVGGGTTGGRIDHIRIIVFYDFMLLPVKLINFSSVKKGNSVELSWTTSGELNLSHYEIERSETGIDFKTIKSVKSLNQVNQVTYTVKDKLSVSNTIYYRLKTIELSGKETYSKIITVKRGNEMTSTIYPTIWKNGTPLHLTNPENKKLEIYLFSISSNFSKKIVTTSREIATSAIENERGILIYKILNDKGELYGTGKLKVN